MNTIYENKTIKLNEAIFLLLYIFWFSFSVIYDSKVESLFGIEKLTLKKITDYFSLALLSVYIIYSHKYTKCQINRIILIALIFMISAFFSKQYNLISALLFVIASKNIDLKKIVKTTYAVLLVLVPLVVILSVIGAIENYSFYFRDVLRYSMGFSHPNHFGLRVFQLFACHVYLNKDSFKTKSLILGCLLIAFTYNFANSQTACLGIVILMTLFILRNLILKIRKKDIKILLYAMIVVAFVINFVSVISSFFGVTSSFGMFLDVLLSNRLTNNHAVFVKYGFSILGQYIELISPEERVARNIIGTNAIFLDNAYITLFYSYGIIVYFIFSISNLLTMVFHLKKENIALILILFAYAIYGITERGVLSLSNNVFLLSMSCMIYKQDYVKEMSWFIRKKRVRLKI